MGTLINAAAVVVGGLIGLIARNVPDKLQDSIMKSLGLVTIMIGLSGVFVRMLSVTETGGVYALNSAGSIMMILSLALGTVVGELLNIEGFCTRLGENLKRRVCKKRDDPRFVDGFVSCTLVICVGAMGIVGALNEGLTGDISMLIAKAVIDAIVTLVFASAYGIGPLFSALPILVYQETLTLLAKLISPVMTESAIASIAMVGSAIIFGVGCNLCFKKTFRVANMIPAVVFAFLFNLLAEKCGLTFLLS